MTTSHYWGLEIQPLKNTDLAININIFTEYSVSRTYII